MSAAHERPMRHDGPGHPYGDAAYCGGCLVEQDRRQVLESHTAHDEACEVIAIHTPELIHEGPNGEDDGRHLYCVECGVLPIDGLGLQYGPQHVVDQLAARGLLRGEGS